MSHRGSLLCLPSGIWAWPVTQPAELTEAALERGFREAADIELFLIGTGRDAWVMPDRAARGAFATRRSCRRRRRRPGPAVRTYNILLGERRRVGGGPDRGGLTAQHGRESLAACRTRSIIASELVRDARLGPLPRHAVRAARNTAARCYALYAFNLEIARVREQVARADAGRDPAAMVARRAAGAGQRRGGAQPGRRRAARGRSCATACRLRRWRV